MKIKLTEREDKT